MSVTNLRLNELLSTDVDDTPAPLTQRMQKQMGLLEVIQRNPSIIVSRYTDVAADGVSLMQRACIYGDEVIALFAANLYGDSIFLRDNIPKIFAHGWVELYISHIKKFSTYNHSDMIANLGGVNICCRRGYVRLFKLIMQYGFIKPYTLKLPHLSKYPIELACEFGQKDMYTMLVKEGELTTQDIKVNQCYALKMAVKNNNIELVSLMLDSNIYTMSDILGSSNDILGEHYIMRWICLNGNYVIYKMLEKHGIIPPLEINKTSTEFLILTVHGGSVELFTAIMLLLGFAKKDGDRIVTDKILMSRLNETAVFDTICKHGRLDMLILINTWSDKLNSDSFFSHRYRRFNIIIENGYTDMFIFAYTILAPSTTSFAKSDVLPTAIANNRFDILEYLLDNMAFDYKIVFGDIYIGPYNAYMYNDIYHAFDRYNHTINTMAIQSDQQAASPNNLSVVTINDLFDRSPIIHRRALLIAADRGYFVIIEHIITKLGITSEKIKAESVDFYNSIRTLLLILVGIACQKGNYSFVKFIMTHFKDLNIGPIPSEDQMVVSLFNERV